MVRDLVNLNSDAPCGGCVPKLGVVLGGDSFSAEFPSLSEEGTSVNGVGHWGVGGINGAGRGAGQGAPAAGEHPRGGHGE